MNKNSTNPRFSLFEELDRGLNHLVKEVLKPEGCKSTAPPLSVYELNDRYVVECDLPGVHLDEVDLQINNGVLEISGERKSPIADDATVTVNERSFSTFARKLQLSKDINADGVDAELGNGVLKVTVPKADSVLAKKIAVRRGGEGA